MKKCFLLLFISFLLIGTVFAITPKEKMMDAFGRGFNAIKNNEKAEAEKYFIEAGNLAIQVGEWQGCLDAANGLSTIGKPSESIRYIDGAFTIAEQQKDWRIAVACGYAYGSLPPDIGDASDAENAFITAGNLAASKNDWIGLTEAANGLINIKLTENSLPILDQAFEIIQDEESLQGCNTLIAIYDRIGDSERKNAVALYKDNALRDKPFVRKNLAPPPGWSPVGTSVAGPKIPDKDQQLAARASADREIESKREWESQQEQLKVERERIEMERQQAAAMYAYADAYRDYYYFPYGYGTYAPGGWNGAVGWADYCLGGYSYANGYYSYNRGYSGFGFSYNYRDRGSGFSIGFGVYDY